MKHSLVVCTEDIRAFWRQAPVRATRGPQWLRRIALKLVSMFGIEDGRATKSVSYREVPTDESFLQRLRLASRDIERISNKEAKTLLVGPDAWPDIADELRNSTTSLALPMEFKAVTPRGDLTLLGIKVVLIPWMEGTLLIPDLPETLT